MTEIKTQNEGLRGALANQIEKSSQLEEKIDCVQKDNESKSNKITQLATELHNTRNECERLNTQVLNLNYKLSQNHIKLSRSFKDFVSIAERLIDYSSPKTVDIYERLGINKLMRNKSMNLEDGSG